MPGVILSSFLVDLLHHHCSANMHQSLVLVLTDPSRDNIETKAKINNFLSGTRGQEHELVALVQNVLAQPQPFRLLRRLVVDTENNKNRLQFASILFDCCLERLQVDEALDRIEADDLLDLLSVLQPQLMQAKIATLICSIDILHFIIIFPLDGISQVKPGDISRLRFLGKTLSAVGNGSFFKHWKLGWQTVWSLPFFEAKQRSMVSHYASIFLPEDVAANLELEALGVEGNANVRSALLDGTTKARLFSIRPRGLDKMQKSDTFLMHGKLKTRLMFIALCVGVSNRFSLHTHPGQSRSLLHGAKEGSLDLPSNGGQQ